MEEFSRFLTEHNGTPKQIASVSMDMSVAFIKDVTKYLPNARITFDKFHVVAHASGAVDRMRRLEQKTDPSLKGLRWELLKETNRSFIRRGSTTLPNQFNCRYPPMLMKA